VTPDEERWAEAMAIHSQHGDHAPVVVAERIGALAMKGDVGGIAHWKDIAARFDALFFSPHQ